MNQNQLRSKCPQCGATIPEDAPESLCPKCLMVNLGAESSKSSTQHQEMTPPSLEELAKIFPELEIIELIGQGGMGFVFKVRQLKLDRIVALKLLPENLSRDPHFAERFNREARVLAKLNHPNIVAVFESGHRNPYYFFLMEYVDGLNLREAMQAGRFSPKEALKLVPQICEALQFAHDQKVLHRDIKPENILLNEKGKIKIADFGIAKITGQSESQEITLTQTGLRMGSPHYMAPEQFENPGEIDHRADIYSLGVVFYELLTGELPIGRFDPPSFNVPMDKTIDRIVMRALEKDRERRQKSADEIKTEVDTVCSHQASFSHNRVSRRPSSSSGSGIMIASSALTTLSLLGAAILIALLMTEGLSMNSVLFLSLPFILCGIPGTVLGWIALLKIRNKDVPLEWKGMALLGSSGFLILVFLGVLMPFFLNHDEGARGLSLFGWGTFTLLGLFASLLYFRTITRWLRSAKLFSWVEIIILVLLISLIVSFLWPIRQSGESSGTVVMTRSQSSHSGGLFQFEQIAPEYRVQDNSIEVVAISVHPSSGRWWLPDGSLWDQEPFINPGFLMGTQNGYRGVEIVTRIQGTNPQIRFQAANAGNHAGGNDLLKSSANESGEHLFIAEFPKDLDQTTLNIGATMEPWETFLETDQLAIGTQVQSVSWWSEILNVELKGWTKNTADSLALVCSHNLNNIPCQVIAVDKSGAEHFGKPTQAKLDSTAEFVFQDLQAEQIDRLKFQVLPYRWKRVEQVHLKPNMNLSVSQIGDPIGMETEIVFSGVDLISSGRHQKLSIVYSFTDLGNIPVWTTSPVQDDGLIKMETVTELSDTKSESDNLTLIRKMEVLLPKDLSDKELLKLLQRTQQTWKGRSLSLYPGDQHEILSIPSKGTEPISVCISLKE